MAKKKTPTKKVVKKKKLVKKVAPKVEKIESKESVPEAQELGIFIIEETPIRRRQGNIPVNGPPHGRQGGVPVNGSPNS